MTHERPEQHHLFSDISALALWLPIFIGTAAVLSLSTILLTAGLATVLVTALTSGSVHRSAVADRLDRAKPEEHPSVGG